MKRVVSGTLFVLAFAATACTKDKPADTSAADAGQASNAAPSGAPSASAVASAAPAAEAPLPSEHRADVKAVQEISTSNYKAELDKVEKEIGAP